MIIGFSRVAMIGDLDKKSFIDEQSEALLSEFKINGRGDVEVASINSFKEVWYKRERNEMLAGGERELLHFLLKNGEMICFCVNGYDLPGKTDW